MFSILWMLFVAWFLQLFGFDNIVIKGLVQLGRPEIGMMGYYLIFATAGLIKNIAHAFRSTIADACKEFDKID